MSISIDKLIEEKTLLQKDFDEFSKKIKQVEIEVVQMRAKSFCNKVFSSINLSILILIISPYKINLP
jgi:hypothetical protein